MKLLWTMGLATAVAGIACGGNASSTQNVQDGSADGSSSSGGGSSTGSSGGVGSGSGSGSGATSSSGGTSSSGASTSSSSTSSGGSSSTTSSGGSLDSGTPDAGLSCGSLTCGPAQFCEETGSRGGPLDGGSNETFACRAIPQQCEPKPTCDCLKAPDGGLSNYICSEQNGEFTLAFLPP